MTTPLEYINHFKKKKRPKPLWAFLSVEMETNVHKMDASVADYNKHA